MRTLLLVIVLSLAFSVYDSQPTPMICFECDPVPPEPTPTPAPEPWRCFKQADGPMICE